MYDDTANIPTFWRIFIQKITVLMDCNEDKTQKYYFGNGIQVLVNVLAFYRTDNINKYPSH